MRLGNIPDEVWWAFCGRCWRMVIEDESKVLVEAAWEAHLAEFHPEKVA